MFNEKERHIMDGSGQSRAIEEGSKLVTKNNVKFKTAMTNTKISLKVLIIYLIITTTYHHQFVVKNNHSFSNNLKEIQP